MITEDRPFPVEHLPPTSAGWWLTVVLDDGDGIDEADVYEMFLPLDGPSFVCTCTPGGLHHCRDRRWEYLQMFFRAQDVPGTMSLRVMIYLESALVQAIELAVPVGVEGTASGRITWSRTEAITELDLVAKRSVSAFSDERDGGHRFVFGAGRGTYAAFELGEAQAGSLARSLRAGLYRAHFDVSGKHLVSRYDDSLSLDRDRNLADLRALAVEGAKAYQALVMDGDTRDRMRAWLAAEATVLARSSTRKASRVCGGYDTCVKDRLAKVRDTSPKTTKPTTKPATKKKTKK
ncbi:MAG: hypothetical protein HOY78_08180 [Saccharothrix sp.]|nr:hypothetical protein [Saccharothrix sp.]